MKNPLEKEIEGKLTDMVKDLGGWCLKWVCPGWGGVPDRILLMPGGRVYFVETKRPKGGKVAALQKWWKKQLTGLGFTVWHIFDTEQLETVKLVLIDDLSRK